MTALRKASFVRLLALVAVLALVAAACTGGGTTETTADGGTDTTEEPTDTTAPPTDDTTDDTEPDTTDEPSTGGELDTYTLGIFQDVTTDNVWNLIDTAGNTVWNSYFLDPTTAALYDIELPGNELQPDLAAEDLGEVVQDGDVWVGEVTMRDDIVWSDGEPITAEDVAFTWETAVEFELTANWQDYVDADIITSVEAVDDTTVRITFNAQPGLAVWGPGTSFQLMPVQPEHFWGPVVEEARGTDNPRETLRAGGSRRGCDCLRRQAGGQLRSHHRQRELLRRGRRDHVG